MYLSNKYSGIVEDFKNDTKKMGTSLGVALSTYIKQ
jgi:hypothetical protein